MLEEEYEYVIFALKLDYSSFTVAFKLNSLINVSNRNLITPITDSNDNDFKNGKTRGGKDLYRNNVSLI